MSYYIKPTLTEKVQLPRSTSAACLFSGALSGAQAVTGSAPAIGSCSFPAAARDATAGPKEAPITWCTPNLEGLPAQSLQLAGLGWAPPNFPSTTTLVLVRTAHAVVVGLAP